MTVLNIKKSYGRSGSCKLCRFTREMLQHCGRAGAVVWQRIHTGLYRLDGVN